MGGVAQGDQEILQHCLKDMYIINFIKLPDPQSCTEPPIVGGLRDFSNVLSPEKKMIQLLEISVFLAMSTLPRVPASQVG